MLLFNTNFNIEYGYIYIDFSFSCISIISIQPILVLSWKSTKESLFLFP